jgi:flagellar hook assembly protein FlgD
VTEIAYGIPSGSPILRVRIDVYDAIGRRVSKLVDSDRGPGTYRVIWDGRNDRGAEIAGGVYFYRITWNGKSETKRMVLLK